jgi:hypothetical protein
MYCVQNGVGCSGVWLNCVAVQGVDTFCEMVGHSLGHTCISLKGKKASLKLKKASGDIKGLIRAKLAVEQCSSREGKLNKACVGAKNIAAILDLASIDGPKKNATEGVDFVQDTSSAHLERYVIFCTFCFIDICSVLVVCKHDH